MTDDRERIKFRYSMKQGIEDALGRKSGKIFAVNGWKALLVLVPIFILFIFFSAFLFSIIFPLFLIGGIAAALWIWWLRRRLLKSNHAQSLEGEYRVIKETQIVETKTEKREDE